MESNQLICPKCGQEIQDGESCVVCPVCGVPQHKACWEENGGCAAESCPARAVEQQPIAEEEAPVQEASAGGVCHNCLAPMAEGQLFCSVCGAQRAAEPPKCPFCGAAVVPGQNFCASCGQPLPTPAPQKKKPKRTWVWILIGAVAAIIVFLIVLGIGNKEEPQHSGSSYTDYYTASDLQKMLMENRWWSKNDNYPSLQLFLDINEKEIVYSAYAESIGAKEIARIPYTVYDGDTILIYKNQIDIGIYESGISFTPSPFNDDPYSIWVKLD